MSDYTSESASHFCRICGAWWLCSWDGTWQLKSEQAGEDCCNNQPMHGNTHLVSVRAALEAIGNIAGRGDADRLRAELAAEREKNEALRKDAERYRWLRGREDGRYMTVYAFRTDIDEVCLGDELDAAIDAARAAEPNDRRDK